MNKELILNPDFIRCSVIIAELLIKYKSKTEKESEGSEESQSDSEIHIFIFGLVFSLIIVYNSHRCVLLTKICDKERTI